MIDSFGAMRKLWIAGAALVISGGGGGAWVWASGDHGPSDPPDGPWPMDTLVDIRLCGKDPQMDDGKCKDVVTEAQKQAVLAKLQSMPGISEAWASTYDNDLGGSVKGRLVDRDRFPAIKTVVDGMPGVVKAYSRPKDFWVGKSDLEIILCPTKGCQGRGAATDAEKDAVYQRLRQLPQVAEVYFADREFVARVARHNARSGGSGGWELEAADPHEEFHVRLVQPSGRAAAERIGEVIKAMPGVWMAS